MKNKHIISILSLIPLSGCSMIGLGNQSSDVIIENHSAQLPSKRPVRTRNYHPNENNERVNNIPRNRPQGNNSNVIVEQPQEDIVQAEAVDIEGVDIQESSNEDLEKIKISRPEDNLEIEEEKPVEKKIEKKVEKKVIKTVEPKEEEIVQKVIIEKEEKPKVVAKKPKLKIEPKVEPKPKPKAIVAKSTPAPKPAKPVELVSLDSKPATILAKQSDAAMASGNYDKAASLLDRAVGMAPTDAKLWHKMAKTRMAQGQFQSAATMATRSNSYANGQSSLKRLNWKLIAKAREKTGDFAGAETAMRYASN